MKAWEEIAATVKSGSSIEIADAIKDAFYEGTLSEDDLDEFCRDVEEAMVRVLRGNYSIALSTPVNRYLH